VKEIDELFRWREKVFHRNLLPMGRKRKRGESGEWDVD
jgi:hypothetical protein